MLQNTSIFIAGLALVSLNPARAESKVPESIQKTVFPEARTALSAEHQSNDEQDVEITRRIRRAVVRDDSLSLYAQNIKIITKEGHVVLKGPVRNEGEKAKVEQHAAKVAGRENVSSEIEVAR